MYGQGLGSRDYEVFGLLQEFTVYMKTVGLRLYLIYSIVVRASCILCVGFRS